MADQACTNRCPHSPHHHNDQRLAGMWCGGITDVPIHLQNMPEEHRPGHDPDWCGLLTSKASRILLGEGYPELAEHVIILERWHARGNQEHLFGAGLCTGLAEDGQP